MIYLELFYTFFKIGLFTFGGGYAMIPLIKEYVLNFAWMTEEELLNFIAISESTPGPIAVNMATFVGSSQGGFLGGLLATFGVILPSFLIILTISIFIKNLFKKGVVKAVVDAIKPAITGLILATGITLFLSVIFNLSTVKSEVSFDAWGLVIFAVVVGCSFLYKKIRKKTVSPILLILLSAVLGVLCYGVF